MRSHDRYCTCAFLGSLGDFHQGFLASTTADIGKEQMQKVLHRAIPRGALAASLAGGVLCAYRQQSAASEPEPEPQLAAEATAGPSSVAQVATQSLPPAETLGLTPSSAFACYRGSTGERVALSEVLRAAEKVDVVIVGETHDDPVAHQLELYLLMRLQQQPRPCRLSLEMFERDVQPVLDEYLAGCIRERDLLQDARPWANYDSDYRPMVEFCKAANVPVLAANVPRRYVGACGRDAGALAALEADDGGSGGWPRESRPFLPPLPLPTPSAGYLQHLLADPAVLRADQVGLEAKAGQCPYIGLSQRDGLLHPMLLWDAGMAHAIASSLERHPGELVYHVCGSFHCERSHGVAEMLRAYRPQASSLTVVVIAEDDCDAFREEHRHKGDFVLLTDASLRRSHDYYGHSLE
jgi:uncharacterized iron-regulated protein